MAFAPIVNRMTCRNTRRPAVPFVPNTLISGLDIVLNVTREIGHPKKISDRPELLAYLYLDLAFSICERVTENQATVAKAARGYVREVWSEISNRVAAAYQRQQAAESSYRKAESEAVRVRRFMDLGYSVEDCNSDPQFRRIWAKLKPEWPTKRTDWPPEALETTARTAARDAGVYWEKAIENLREAKKEMLGAKVKSFALITRHEKVLARVKERRMEIVTLSPRVMKRKSDFGSIDPPWMMKFWKTARNMLTGALAGEVWGFKYWLELYALRYLSQGKHVWQTQLDSGKQRFGLEDGFKEWILEYGISWGIDPIDFDYFTVVRTGEQQDSRVNKRLAKIVPSLHTKRAFLDYVNDKKARRAARSDLMAMC